MCPQGDVSRLWCHLSEGGAPDAICGTKPRLECAGRRCGSGRWCRPGGRAGPPFQSSLLWGLRRDTEARGHFFWRHCEQSNGTFCARQTGGVGCSACRGVIVTGVLYENVWIWSLQHNSSAFLYLIVSVSVVPKVYSGYRFLLAASDRKMPVAILNIGSTRADHLAELKVSGRCGEVLSVIQPLWLSWTCSVDTLY